MRQVDIATTRDRYVAGETVEGVMIVRCDRAFQCNAIHLTFVGREHTKIEVSDSDSSTTYTDERVYFTSREDFDVGGVVAAGETQYPFRFRLPDDVPSSYTGVNGWIEYRLTGVVEVTWATDPKRQTTIAVRQPAGRPAGQIQQHSIDKNGQPVFDVELEADSVCLGEPIRLRFRVARDVKIRGVRIQLQAKEFAAAKRMKREAKRVLVRQMIQEREIGRDLWTNVELDTHESMPHTFEREIVRNEASVKVTLDVPWARDKWVAIPVRLSHCGNASGSDKKDEFGSDWRFA